MEKNTIGSFIAALRKAKGLTQRQLADMLNISDKAVSRWERNETAPDLSLIPVLADIFEVTSDELLRGQRSTSRATDTKYDVRQTEKQVQYLLNRSKTEFQILCVITSLIALCGFIAAMICNMFNRANLGFYISLIFYAAAAACQAIFLIQTKSNIQNNEITGIDNVVKDLVILSETVYTIIAGLFAATLPLLTYISDAYWGLSVKDWLIHGFVHGAIGIALARLVIYFINCRLGYAARPDLGIPKNKLRIRTLVSTVLILTVTFAAHVFTHEFLNAYPHFYAEGTRWENWDALKEYLETPISPDGEEMELVSLYGETYHYQDSSGNHYQLSADDKSVLVYERDMTTPKYEFVRKNLSVARFSYSLTDDHFPIYTYSQSEMTIAENRLAYINIAICALYLIELTASSVIYARKAKKL